MVDSRALQSKYVWPDAYTYAAFPPKVDAYMYAANTAPKHCDLPTQNRLWYLFCVVLF